MKQRVELFISREMVIGDLHLPDNHDPLAAVVVAGPMTSVKEQVTGVYAAALAERGFAALALDHRHYGESGGEPRQYERYSHKIEDLRGAIDWLSEQPSLPQAKLGLVGVCLGAGYAAWASIDHPKVSALAAVAGYYRDVAEMTERDPAGFQQKIDQGVAARRHYEATKEVLTIPAVALRGDAAMTLPDTFDYYGTPRAAVPNYKNAFAVMSREHFLPFDVQSAAQRITAPITMIHSKKALSPIWAERFYQNVRGPKALEWLTSENQVDFYDNPQLVAQSCEIIARHLRAHLT